LCGIYPRHPQIAVNTTQIKAGNSRNDCAEFTHAPSHKSHCTIAPNTTQTKASNGRNNCVEFTHAPTSHGCTTSTNTTQTKAGNGRNDCAEFTHAPTVMLYSRPKKSGNGRIDYVEFSHGGHQIPASKNILKTLFSKGELGTIWVMTQYGSTVFVVGVF